MNLKSSTLKYAKREQPMTANNKKTKMYRKEMAQAEVKNQKPV